MAARFFQKMEKVGASIPNKLNIDGADFKLILFKDSPSLERM
jgi:hypothetical protein